MYGKVHTLGVRPNLPDWIRNLSNSSKHSLLRQKNLQRTSVKKKLHVQYLQKYKSNNMIPPGLNVKKTPQIKCLTKENKIAWENSLNKTSKTLLYLLISQHSSDLKTINIQLETSKTELYRLNDINNNIELIDNWLRNDKDSYFNFLEKQKEQKFNHHLSTAKIRQSSSNVHNNKPSNQKCTQNSNSNNGCNNNENDSSVSTGSQPKKTIHVVRQSNAESMNQKKRKRRYRKGRTTKTTTVQT